MRAMLLAAGFGDRMLPLTLTVPKAAIPVLGRPLAVQILRRLAQAGVSCAVLNLHHLPNVMRQLFEPGKSAGLPSIEFSHEETLLGTAGGLRRAADRLRGEGPILVCNADTLSDVDVAAALDEHRRSRRLATLVLTDHRPGYSKVDVDADGTIISLAGVPEADPARVAGSCLYTGVQIIEEEILDRIPERFPSDIVRDVYRDLLPSGRVGSYLHRGFWWEFGSPARYIEGSWRLLELCCERGERITEHDPVQALDRAIASIGPGAKQHETAVFNGRVGLGLASYVSKGSRVEDTVVMPEAWIGPDCRLNRVVVGPGVEIPAGFEAANALVCADRTGRAEMTAGIVRRDGLLIQPFESVPAG